MASSLYVTEKIEVERLAFKDEKNHALYEDAFHDSNEMREAVGVLNARREI